MDFYDLLIKGNAFVWFIVSGLICSLAAKLHRETEKRGFLLVAIASGMGAAATILPWLADDEPPIGFWYFWYGLNTVDALVWFAGMWLLFDDYGELLRRPARPAAGTDSDNAKAEPPSVRRAEGDLGQSKAQPPHHAPKTPQAPP